MPPILVSYKQGLTYTEDFYAPERGVREGALPSDGRPYEVCTTLQPRSWGYRESDDGKHHGPDWVMDQLAQAAAIPANLLLIMCDDLGFGDVGFNGGDRIKTPHLDRLAESSVRLTNLDPDGAHDQLYDLDTDRGETTDLVDDHRDLQRRCREYLERFLASCRHSHAGGDYDHPVDMITPFQEPGGWMAEKV